MIEAKYYKDFRHNYLIIKSDDCQSDMYQCKMITSNKIEGLIPCMERHINGEMLLYYEITSKQSLASLYEDNWITMKQLNKLFMQIKRTWDGISKFLLKESSLVLKPEFIFTDVETEEFLFLYYPFETEENYIVLLLEFLTDRVNNEDKEAVEVTYKMLELATKEQFVLDEVLEWFEEEHDENIKEEGEYRECREEYDETSNSEKFENKYSDRQEDEKDVGKKNSYYEKAAFFGMILSLALEGVLYYIYDSWQLSERMLIYLYAGAVMLGGLFLFNGFWLLYQKTFHRDSLIWNKLNDLRSRDREEEDKPYQSTMIHEKVQEQAKAAYGNTIFIPWVESCENKLYGMEKGNKNHIDLNRLPLTVGKLAGSVDMVIDDQSISRRHVKFVREGNRICMVDLNSTNGTFKNGLRLQPNMSEILEPGDEIRLGKLKFIYR